jgi:nitrite reductase/ring-hydroxylating ferredoxin subunit
MLRGYRLGIFVLLILSVGCMKDNSGIPNVIIDIPPISLQNPEYSRLLSPGASAFLEGGIAGIVVYNTGNGYVAYDRCSTVNPEKRCAVELDETGLNLIDPCSGGKFDLATGFTSKAPSKHALKRYHVTVSGAILYIRN